MLRKKEKIRLLDSKPRIRFFTQAGFGTAFTCLTSGVFLNGLALLMGAGDVLISYLSVIINICGVVILLFSAFLERFQSRKRLTIILTILSRLVTVLIVVIPALVPGKAQLVLFIPMVIVAFTLQAQTTVVLNQWMLGFVDEKKSGRYISLRQTLTLSVTVILSIVGGFWIDFMEVSEKKYFGFVVLFVLAGFMGLCEVLLLMRTPDSERYQSSSKGCRLRDIAKIPLKNKCFTGFVCYIVVFYLLLNISDSFTMVYMMRYLKLPYKTITALTMIISLPQVFLLSIWGRISDWLGHNFALKASIWLFAGETLFMSMASRETWYIFIPIAFLMAAVGNAGFIVAVFNRRYELMPEDNRIVYDNFYTAAIGLGFILGPMIGGVIKGVYENSTIVMESMDFASIRLLYPISAIGILLLQVIYLYSEKRKN